MIYLDNAATSYPKPACVREAVCKAMTLYGANPGRGGHRMSIATAERVYAARETAAKLFYANSPTDVVFTSNATSALNMALQGLSLQGKQVVVSSMEHNAVMRPLTALQKQGTQVVTVTVAPADDAATVATFARALTPQTAAIVCTHASNVTGEVLPIRQIGALAAARGIPFVVDASQTAGLIPIDMQKDHIDFLCMPGHKGLYGPTGTGMLIQSGRFALKPLLYGGTGSESASWEQPRDWPEQMESGTVNVVGILGLDAGMHWVMKRGVERTHRQEMAKLQYLYQSLKSVESVKLYGCTPQLWRHVPLLSFNLDGYSGEEVAALLDEAGVAVRAGLHCAPSAHRQIGTEACGTVRVSLSAFTTVTELENIYKIIVKISSKPLQMQKNVIK